MTQESKIRISDSAEVCVIDIEGVIGVPEECQFDGEPSQVATYEKFRMQVERISHIESPTVIVNIRSTGGDVNDAMLIYEALSALDARITTRCYGYTASAATIIAQAADEGCREISANGLYLIHNSVCAVEGNAETLSSRLDLLRKTDERIAAVYAARSGRPAGEFVALMNENNGDGRWLSPEETLEAGLADRIVGAEEQSSRDSVIRDIAERIVRLFGGGSRETLGQPLPAAASILHLPEPEPAPAPAQSVVAFEEGQNAAAPTRTAECEDPADDDMRPSPNALAYSADARNLRRG